MANGASQGFDLYGPEPIRRQNCSFLVFLVPIRPTVSSMMIPNSLILFLGLIFCGFMVVLSGSMRKKSLEPKYQPIGNPGVANAPSQNQTTTNSSYQNQGSEGYAIPDNQKKDLTYCVIDGRLVDQS